jgi:hypothetical protein
MQLPDLKELDQLFHNTQSNESLKSGYACFTCDSYRGVGAFCFCDDLEGWKDLYPAIIFIEALLDQDYEIYDAEDLEKLKAIYFKYQNADWTEADFDTFRSDLSGVLLSYNIEFLGKTSLLLTNNSDDDFIERLHKQFKGIPKENEIKIKTYKTKNTSKHVFAGM